MAQELRNTLASFEERVRRYIKQEDASTSQWSSPLIKQFINAWYRFRVAECVMAHEGFFTLIGTRDLVANAARYAWPSSMTRLLKMELVRTDGRRVPVQRWERHYTVVQPAVSSGDSYTPTYRPVGSGFLLEPAPLEAVTGGLYLEWNGTPDEMTDDGDGMHADFPQEFAELVIIDAAVACFDQEGMQESGQRRSLAAQRLEWADRFKQYINQRMVSRQNIEPFITHYQDA